MNTMRVLYHLALADFYERARRYSFLLILAAVIFMGVLVNNGTLFLSLGSNDPNLLSSSYRGEFNSAWIGTMTVLVLNNFLGLFGFYLVSDCIKRDIRTGVGQIIATTPVSRAAYLIGKWDFYGLELEITRDVLIPRADTEILAQKAIGYINSLGRDARALDLCTGSGCIGLAILSCTEDCHIVLADSSDEAIKLARRNARKYDKSGRISCVHADALKAAPLSLGAYDLIVCNPPYIPSGDIAKLDESVRNYEPVAALDGGEDGLLFYRAIAPRWKILLKERGCMMFECGIDQAKAVSVIMIQAGFKNTRITKDTINVERVVAGLSL
jgi:release factor glutamine methyltransferase